MPAFSYASLPETDYDFTKIPDGAGGFCTGKGVVTEPSDARVVAFQLALRDLVAPTDAPAEPLDPEAPVVAPTDDEIKALTGETLTKLRQVIADFCAGAPTLEDLETLPPRALAYFLRWLLEEFVSPKE